MALLVIETFLLMAASVALGVAVGVGLRETSAAFPLRPRALPAGAVAPETGPEPEAEPFVEDTAGAPAGAADAVVDPVRAAAADQVGIRPPALSGPRDGRADDLKRIRGIGPQTEARLAALGVHHLDQIAAWSAEETRWVGVYLGLSGRIERDDWVGQARAATIADSG